MKSKECKVKYTDIEDSEFKIEVASFEVTRDGKIVWNRAKGKNQQEKANQEYVDR